MKEFISAVEDVEAEDEREKGIDALIAAATEKGETLSREDAAAQYDEDNESFIEFKIDGRVCRAYQPTEGQLTFMLAALGRGQNQDQRFAAILNIMLSSLRDADADYIEGRLLSRGKDRLPVKVIEQIFESLVEEWFARPTQ